MQCPVDGTTLVITDRQGIEIDYCPQCRGIWLDRGELDKIIERAAQYEAQLRTDPAQPQTTYVDDDDDSREYYPEKPKLGQDDYEGRRSPRKRRSFLDDIFDVFD